MITACAWCPKGLEELEAIKQGVDVSHGICAEHDKALRLSMDLDTWVEAYDSIKTNLGGGL